MPLPNKYLVWDLETSGFDHKTCRILEIGAMLIEEGKVVDEKSWLLKHEIVISEEITKINGITNEMMAGGVDPHLAFAEFLEMMKRAEWKNLTHNGFRFDIPFLLGTITAAQREEHEAKMWEGCLDTAVAFKAKALKMAQGPSQTYRDFASRVMNIRVFGLKYNVGICCDQLGIDRSAVTQHRALGDVFLTNEIFKKLHA